MEKEVFVSVKGVQFSQEDSDCVEIISPGNYYYKDGRHYVMYEETQEDGLKINNILKVSDEKSEPNVELIKKGEIMATMIFGHGKSHVSSYQTPYGNIMLGFNTTDITIDYKHEEIYLKVEYSLEMNSEHVSDNKIEIKIKSKSCMDLLD